MMLSPKNSPHLILTMAVLAAGPLSGQTLFTDDFESYAVGEVPAWDGNIGGNVVDETTMELFGSPNKAMQFNGGGQKLMKDVAADADKAEAGANAKSAMNSSTSLSPSTAWRKW